ncbi:hypothetical protein RHSIM_Rhsim01G0085400 [Rhododendron simsii]|uniref:Uncharacterized protein n=1 Tax=Rhododendron simsii TaxID=118357 RepID=A0A834HHQ4_RHOSS|nr:hypothetical protein RHSIM_Rhsim01G0085400 [Rhododendron simsii]
MTDSHSSWHLLNVYLIVQKSTFSTSSLFTCPITFGTLMLKLSFGEILMIFCLRRKNGETQWRDDIVGSGLLCISQKIKKCRLALNSWRSSKNLNSRKEIDGIKEEIDLLEARGREFHLKEIAGSEDDWPKHGKRKNCIGSKSRIRSGFSLEIEFKDLRKPIESGSSPDNFILERSNSLRELPLRQLDFGKLLSRSKLPLNKSFCKFGRWKTLPGKFPCKSVDDKSKTVKEVKFVTESERLLGHLQVYTTRNDRGNSGIGRPRFATVASGASSGKLLEYAVGGPRLSVQTAYGMEVECCSGMVIRVPFVQWTIHFGLSADDCTGLE